MKYYYVFAYDDYYPTGGVGDLKGVFKTIDEAGEVASKHESFGENADIYTIGEDGEFKAVTTLSLDNMNKPRQ